MPARIGRRNGYLPNAGFALMIAAVLLFPAAGDPAPSTPEKSLLREPDTVDLSRYDRGAGPVPFVHKNHGDTGSAKPSCSDCHHTTADDQTPGTCAACHTPFDDSAAPTDAVAFHKLCIGCHKAEIERGDTRLSLGCDSCHAANGDQ